MTIDYVIPGATLLDQLNEPTIDGLPDENANDNCVAASIAEALHILTGRTYDGDQLKDAVYGQGWTGFQSAAHYIQYCANAGVTLAAHNDTQAGLVATIHSEVSAGHPVLVTMPSMWGTAPADPVHPSGSTHVGCAVGVGAGEIRVMNPWHAFWQDQPDSWWQARLCYGEIWILRKAASMPTSGATAFYGLEYTADPQVWHCPATGHNLSYGFLAFYQGVKGPNGQSGTEILGLPTSDEYPSGSVTKQQFERGRLLYDSSKSAPWQVIFDQISGDLAAGVAAAQQLQAAQAQIATLRDQLTQLQSQLQTAQSQPTVTPAQTAADQLVAAIRAALASA